MALSQLWAKSRGPEVLVCTDFFVQVSTAILSVTYRISSELRSQATAGLVSTTVGDHVGIRGAVGSLFAFVALGFAARASPASEDPNHSEKTPRAGTEEGYNSDPW